MANIFKSTKTLKSSPEWAEKNLQVKNQYVEKCL